MKRQYLIGLVASLAWLDLRHEWILSLCLFLAVAAIVGPLLLLFGLKNGTMETLRSRLLQDPRNREIRPMVSRSFSPDWLDALEKDAKVAFLVPATRSISASVELKSGTRTVSIEARPTAQGDPLLAENGAVHPEPGQCVLSAEAARKLDIKIGQSLSLIVKRLKGRGVESGNARLVVSGILDARATARTVVFFPLVFLEDIESFKDGQAVPHLGWKGSVPLAQPVFDGVVIGMARAVDPVLKVRLTSGTGLSRLEPLDSREAISRLGYAVDERLNWYLLTTKQAQGKDVVTTIQRRLRGKNAQVLPWVRPIKIRLSDSIVLPLFALPRKSSIQFPWPEPGSGGSGLRQVMLPKDIPLTHDSPVQVEGNSTLRFRATRVPGLFSPGRHVLATPELAGILNLSRRRDIAWDESCDQFILKRRGYAAFRLYAATLDDVEPLKLKLEGWNIPVSTQAERIRDLKELDSHLGMIFWLIALGGLVGGAGSLTASLYASVERKRRDLGVMGLIGFNRSGLFCFPLCQSMFLTLGGLVFALIFYTGMAALINQLFSSQLAQGEHFCHLGVRHLAYAAAGVLLLGQIAAALAAWRVITIDPAEALRDE